MAATTATREYPVAFSIRYLHNHFNLNSDTKGKRCHAHRRSSVLSSFLAEDGNKKIGGTIDHLGIVSKCVAGVNHSKNLDNLSYLTKVADFCLQSRKQVYCR